MTLGLVFCTVVAAGASVGIIMFLRDRLLTKAKNRDILTSVGQWETPTDEYKVRYPENECCVMEVFPGEYLVQRRSTKKYHCGIEGEGWSADHRKCYPWNDKDRCIEAAQRKEQALDEATDRAKFEAKRVWRI